MENRHFYLSFLILTVFFSFEIVTSCSDGFDWSVHPSIHPSIYAYILLRSLILWYQIYNLKKRSSERISMICIRFFFFLILLLTKGCSPSYCPNSLEGNWRKHSFLKDTSFSFVFYLCSLDRFTWKKSKFLLRKHLLHAISICIESKTFHRDFQLKCLCGNGNNATE